MSNIENFIYNAKKKIKKDFIISVIVLAIVAIASYYMLHDWFLPVGILIVMVIVFLYSCYYLHKINSIRNKLSDEEKAIFEKELSFLNFDGADYALTENYIFDYKKIKLIPISSITAIKKWKSIEDESIRTKVKIWINDDSYTYISGEKSISINLYGLGGYYKDLYNYIIQRNSNIEER